MANDFKAIFFAQSNNLKPFTTTKHAKYRFWAIGNGGAGGAGGSGWGAYYGYGGGSGGTGAVSVSELELTKGSIITPSYTNGILQLILNANVIASAGDGKNGSAGQNASAADWKPDDNKGGAGGTGGIAAMGNFLNINGHNGIKGKYYNGANAPGCLNTKFTNTSNIAQAGQDAYFSTTLTNLCLGNAGGGMHGDTSSRAGIGATGGFIVEICETDLKAYVGNKKVVRAFCGNKEIIKITR